MVEAHQKVVEEDSGEEDEARLKVAEGDSEVDREGDHQEVTEGDLEVVQEGDHQVVEEGDLEAVQEADHQAVAEGDLEADHQAVAEAVEGEGVEEGEVLIRSTCSCSSRFSTRFIVTEALFI